MTNKKLTPQEQQEKWQETLKKNNPYGPKCVLNGPLFISIPPEGMVISCPIHPEGHFIRSSVVSMSL